MTEAEAPAPDTPDEGSIEPALPSEELPPKLGAKSAFLGRRREIFWLELKTTFYTILTLGIYRFWMKTRVRRWYWTAIRPGGSPLEYTGTPYEKLLGFLIAVVFLAFYLGLANLILMFASFALFQTNAIAYVLSFIGLLPFYFYARYRARRFLLARTRWRGVRFGLEPGAWGYAWRALFHWLLTILTLGILLPRQTFKLEKYATDRTFLGETRLEQQGTWRMLVPAMVPLYLGVVFSALIVLENNFSYSTRSFDTLAGPGLRLLFLTIPLALYGLIHYRVVSRRILANHKSAGPLGLQSTVNPLRVTWHIVGGTALSLLVAFVPALFLLTIAAFLSIPEVLLEAFPQLENDAVSAVFLWIFSLPRWVLGAAAALLYFTVFLLYGVLNEVFVTLPIKRHYTKTLAITGLEHAFGIQQRPKDDFAEAEGFSEALDVGAAL